MCNAIRVIFYHCKYSHFYILSTRANYCFSNVNPESKAKGRSQPPPCTENECRIYQTAAKQECITVRTVMASGGRAGSRKNAVKTLICSRGALCSAPV
jgi:hypothetical protein